MPWGLLSSREHAYLCENNELALESCRKAFIRGALLEHNVLGECVADFETAHFGCIYGRMQEL